MGMIVTSCPRCRATNMTFDIYAGRPTGVEYGWKRYFELYSECRGCFKGSIFAVSTTDYDTASELDSVEKIMKIKVALNAFMEVHDYVSLKDHVAFDPPEHLPSDVESAFREATACLAIGCCNASGSMFRLAIDLATKGLLPNSDGSVGGPNRQQRKQLNERLGYLFDNNLIPNDLRPLAMCVKDDGNDGAHDGTLQKADAEDLQDFSVELFKRMFTEPERLRLAMLRRAERDRS